MIDVNASILETVAPASDSDAEYTTPLCCCDCAKEQPSTGCLESSQSGP
jgi:hypothetical protein